MTQYTVLDHANERTFPNLSHDKADERASGIKMMISDPSEVEVVEGVYEEYSDYDGRSDGGEDMNVEVVDMTEKTDGGTTQADPGTPAAKAADPRQGSETTNDSPTLQEDPIGYLKNINKEFVNKIKGNDAISKRGFRYIQAELDITTESEVVGWTDDPYGVVVWARAELQDGRAAEAHGEGYPGERGMDKAEWVRYADTRAKNRALSDLTSAGALAVDELRGGFDE